MLWHSTINVYYLVHFNAGAHGHYPRKHQEEQAANNRRASLLSCISNIGITPIETVALLDFSYYFYHISQIIKLPIVLF